MTEHEEAIKYVVDKFRSQDVIVQRSGIELVLKYIDEYYGSANNTLEFVMYDEDAMIEYISDMKPDIPVSVIRGVLEAEDEFFETNEAL